MRLIVFLLLAEGIVALGQAARAETVDFDREIQPVLSDNCFHCHGPDTAQRKAKLRLDTRSGAVADLGGHAAIVPGHADRSELVRRISSLDSDEKMPPPRSDRHLTPGQIALLKRWIDQGAVYPKHWSLVRPVEPPLPEVRQADWVANPIDRFILARLEGEGLRPSPPASRETLLRRVTFDLTGLSPTPAELDQFLADTSPDAYEKVVDRLLASPRYGERMVQEWLDAARYADTNGYQGDPTRTMWPWRDWCIQAMNRNMPFDQFTIEQIAGDLLPNSTPEQRLASGFNRNHTYNGEGGRIPEETRVENVLDRVDTTATTFLGLTLGCAKCHDHKYDPFTQREYYQLSAYFNQCSETGAYPQVGGNALPVMTYGPAESLQKLAALKAVEATAQKALDAQLSGIDQAQTAWEQQASHSPGWTLVEPTQLISRDDVQFTRLGDGSILVSGPSPLTDVHDVIFKSDLTGITAIRLEALGHEALPQGGPGRSEDSGNFVLTQIEADQSPAADPKQVKRLKFASAHATYSQPGWEVSGAIDQDPNSGWAVWKAPDKNNIAAIFAFDEPAGFPGGTSIHLQLHYESHANPHHTMGRFRLSVTTSAVVPPGVGSALAVNREKRSDQQKQQIRDYYRERISPVFKPLNDSLQSAKKAAADLENALPKVMVMDDATPRQTHLLNRGSYDRPGEVVEPGVPAALNPLPAGVPNNRLSLAKWLVDPANPLTARVIVNRYWQQFFGTGIVKTAEDFGVQGERPTHRELLDWLATRIVSSGWNVKAMHRLIVTSSTYRQSSNITPELLERDPDNRLFARGPRYRMSAFQIRDQALWASGLLVEKLGGPPVKPYQPPGVWEEMSLGQIRYEPDKGESLYRRGIYTFWRRTVAPAAMFDVSPRTVCMVRPVRTNTPLQALSLMNDVTYIEAARVISQKLLRDAAATEPRKIDALFRLLTSRLPTDQERSVLTGALARLRGQYGADKKAAEKLAAQGESPRAASLNVQELAAWTALVSNVMNLDEVITTH